jgi:DNA-binding transcriptional ArsR family regulator
MRWEPPVLLTPYPKERDLHLDGRGLLLVPSFFCWRMPITLVDPSLPPVLVYPVEHDLRWLEREPDHAGDTGDRRLAALLGSTRAAVLDVIGRGPATTSEIARRVRISAPSASEHASVLRGAGLIRTSRAGNTALHSISQAGVVLLDSPRGA